MSGMNWQRGWDPLRELQREVGRLFETIEPRPFWRHARPFPAINLYEQGEGFVLTAELPGVRPEDFELTVLGESLTLRGERRRPEGVGDEQYRRQERPFGRWERVVPLPQQVDAGRATAELADGVLTIMLPKAEASRPRQIAVTAAGP